MKLNLDYLLETLWDYLSLICIYTKKRGGNNKNTFWYLHLSILFFLWIILFFSERPDFNDAIIMRRGASVEHCVNEKKQTNARLMNFVLNK